MYFNLKFCTRDPKADGLSKLWQANLLTGLVNMSMHTIFVSSSKAFATLLAYLAALVGMMALAEAKKLRLKFWWCDPIVAYKMPSSFLWLGWTLFIFSVDLLRYSFSSVWDKMTNLYSSQVRAHLESMGQNSWVVHILVAGDIPFVWQTDFKIVWLVCPPFLAVWSCTAVLGCSNRVAQFFATVLTRERLFILPS